MSRGWLMLSLITIAGCATRAIPPRAVVWDDVAPLLARACVPCHGPERAEAGWRADTYLSAIACPSEGSMPAVEPPDARAAILAVLTRDDHAGLLTEDERALLGAWCEEGAAPREGRAHPAGFVDPRSVDFHGVVLRSERWARMLAPSGVAACSRCHDGVDPEGAPRTTDTAPGATACTSCHEGEAGPRGCATCHGEGARAYPPRSGCFHPDEATRGGAHAAHDQAGVGCAVCHGERTADQLADGPHGDGMIDVVLDVARAGEGARFDPGSNTCTVACHDRGGTTPMPRWEGGEGLDCGACHASPPEDHDYLGGCDGCHDEATADGTALVPGSLHLNGVVDLGDGSGECGACHGAGEDPTPQSGAHLAHAGTALRVAIDCTECHAVPDEPMAAGHLDASPGAEVMLGALASARGSSPTFGEGTCAGVACHGAGLGGGTNRTVSWQDGPIACDACHGAPPPAPHTRDLRCSALSCHGGYATLGPGISELGRTVHVDGRIDTWPPR